MPPAHGCPTFLIESAFPAMLSLKGDDKEEVGSMGARRLHERIVLAWKICKKPGRERPEEERPVSRIR